MDLIILSEISLLHMEITIFKVKIDQELQQWEEEDFQDPQLQQQGEKILEDSSITNWEHKARDIHQH